jgi:hypothetical protein
MLSGALQSKTLDLCQEPEILVILRFVKDDLIV